LPWRVAAGVKPDVRGLSMWKKLLILLGILGVAAYVVKKVKDANDERALWHEATTTDLR
jgi:hypothetical protein